MEALAGIIIEPLLGGGGMDADFMKCNEFIAKVWRLLSISIVNGMDVPRLNLIQTSGQHLRGGSPESICILNDYWISYVTQGGACNESVAVCHIVIYGPPVTHTK